MKFLIFSSFFLAMVLGALALPDIISLLPGGLEGVAKAQQRQQQKPASVLLPPVLPLQRVAGNKNPVPMLPSFIPAERAGVRVPRPQQLNLGRAVPGGVSREALLRMPGILEKRN